jgi:hypothetical protein
VKRLLHRKYRLDYIFVLPIYLLAALIEKLTGHVEFAQFAFLQGLDSPVREEVLQ